MRARSAAWTALTAKSLTPGMSKRDRVCVDRILRGLQKINGQNS
jgi:hypothetical protein